ncbi:MAG: hypothetical protein IPO37_07240 [Saprospiraceae bacterium]|nr:hypothetical protein [Saprospiraceae bacterium]
MVHNHMYLGIGLTIMVVGLYFTFQHQRLQNVLWVTTAIILTITGHLGGSLTHGEHYLSLTKHEDIQKPKIDMNHSVVFSDVIQPILQENVSLAIQTKTKRVTFALTHMTTSSKVVRTEPSS